MAIRRLPTALPIQMVQAESAVRMVRMAPMIQTDLVVRTISAVQTDLASATSAVQTYLVARSAAMVHTGLALAASEVQMVLVVRAASAVQMSLVVRAASAVHMVLVARAASAFQTSQVAPTALTKQQRAPWCLSRPYCRTSAHFSSLILYESGEHVRSNIVPIFYATPVLR